METVEGVVYNFEENESYIMNQSWVLSDPSLDKKAYF